MSQAPNACATCARRVVGLAGRYRQFLIEPATLFTGACLVLLVLAVIQHPAGLYVSREAGSRLYLAAALAGGSFIWWSAVQGIRAKDFTADIPVSVATIAAIAIGQYSAAAVVAALLLIGGMLENLIAARAGHALEALARLLPSTVTLRDGGIDRDVPLESVRPGQLLLVRSGDRFAVDGRIESGRAWVDQAAITGESVPAEKASGDAAFAGTFCQSGALELRVEKVGEDTALGQIRTMIEQAQQDKAPIERLLDRYAKLYTPVALAMGAVLWLVTGDVLRAITLLIVFCPCVMVLATPTALVASIGNAALRGSLIKKGSTIEGLARVDTVAFDKTGTLTQGRPRLVDVLPLNGLASPELLRLAAAAEKFSEHPLGRAVMEGAAKRQLGAPDSAERALSVPDPEAFEPVAGAGVAARVDGHAVLMGRMAMLEERGVRVGEAVQRQVETLEAGGRSVLPMAVDGEVAGLLLVEDSPREGARAALAQLQRMGIRTLLISGDRSAPAEHLARQMGIDEVHANVFPRDKLELVRRLQGEGRVVAFVGDGVNDGPALAAADVGVAMGLAGTDVAVETAQIALLSDDVSKLPHLLAISRLAMKAIRQNVMFSTGVLAIAVVLTVTGILTPVTGALLHELSSIPVILNSARLIKHRSEAPADAPKLAAVTA